jgi:hypothetical protein
VTATVEALPNGKNLHRVFEDGVEVQTRTSPKRYGFILLQRWEGDTRPGHQAYRFASKPKGIGTKIDYGFCAGNVPIRLVGT